MKIKKQKRLLILSVVLTIIISSAAFAEYTDGPINSDYSRTNAAQYIYNYTVIPNNAYFDFAYFGGDCTNFVSQVLAAGGMPMTQSVSKPTTNDWYYYGPYWGLGRTATWTNSHCFRYFWIDVNNIGAKKAYAYTKYCASDCADNSTWYSIYSCLEPGDIIQYVNAYNYTTYHSQAVHRTSYEKGEFKISIGQHTTNCWRNLRNYISALPEDTIVFLIKIKQPASTDTGYLGSYSGKTVAELDISEDYLFNIIPLTETQENEKWSRLSAIKEELIKRVKNNHGIKDFVIPITKNALTEVIDIRMENNCNIINATNYNIGISERNIRLINECKKENTALEAFHEKLAKVDSEDNNHIKVLWNEYWNSVVKQTPPIYYR